ncbi:MAG: hypothetical protein AB4290_05320 [Spirulina sp.]
MALSNRKTSCSFVTRSREESLFYMLTYISLAESDGVALLMGDLVQIITV